MAQLRFKIKPSQVEFFEINSLCREYWLRSYCRPNRFFPSIPQQFSILHIAVQQGIPTLADYISYSDNQHHKAGGLIYIVNCVDTFGETPLEYTTRSGHLSIVSVLLDLGGKVTTLVMQVAVRNLNNRMELMILLLNRRGDQITIIEEVVKAAVGNFRNSKKVIVLLLDQ